jgi:hypothetical protein
MLQEIDISNDQIKISLIIGNLSKSAENLIDIQIV